MAKRRTLVVSIDCDDQKQASASTLQWAKGLSGEYVDREDALNDRPCYLREDGARIYWDRKGWWIHDKAFAVYAYHGGDDKDVPADGWQCPGKLYLYVGIGLEVRVKAVAGRSFGLDGQDPCMQGVNGLLAIVKDPKNQEWVKSNAAHCAATAIGVLGDIVSDVCQADPQASVAKAKRSGDCAGQPPATRAVTEPVSKAAAQKPDERYEILELPAMSFSLSVAEGQVGIQPSGCPPGRVLVKKVVSGSRAAASNVRPGDELLSLNGVPVASMNQTSFDKAMRQRPLTIRMQQGS